MHEGTTVRARFDAKHEPDARGCWIWTAWKARGYGRMQIGGRAGRPVRAHRVSWELNRGPIPDGMCVLHNCPDGDNPLCVNPAHLWLGTHADNMADMASKGRAARHLGEDHVNAVLTDKDVVAIRSRWPAESQRALAREFGVSPRAINFVVHMETWRHV